METPSEDNVLTPELCELLANLVNQNGLGSLVDPTAALLAERKAFEDHQAILSPRSEGSSLVNSQGSSERMRNPTYNSREYRPPIMERSPSNLTTFMLKNLPRRMTREELFSLLHRDLPLGVVNFLYVPIDYGTGENFGYAFVNLVSEQYVEGFTKSIRGKRLDSPSPRRVEVSPARVQGFTANINRLIGSKILSEVEERSLPLIFYNNVQVSFRDLMNLNRASILYQTKPSVEDLIHALISDDQCQYI
jgi:hypothetical protein